MEITGNLVMSDMGRDVFLPRNYSLSIIDSSSWFSFRYVNRSPILVNSSTVFLQFQANRQNVDRFEAAFAFHDGK